MCINTEPTSTEHENKGVTYKQRKTATQTTTGEAKSSHLDSPFTQAETKQKGQNNTFLTSGQFLIFNFFFFFFFFTLLVFPHFQCFWFLQAHECCIKAGRRICVKTSEMPNSRFAKEKIFRRPSEVLVAIAR